MKTNTGTSTVVEPENEEETDAVPVGTGDWFGVLSVVTFLIYTLVWDVGLLAGAAYVIFWKGASGWWFLPAALLCTMSYKPEHWRKLWVKNKPDGPPKNRTT